MDEEIPFVDPQDDPCDTCDDQQYCDSSETLFCCRRCRWLGMDEDCCERCMGDLRYDIT